MVLYILIGTLAAFGFLCLFHFLLLWFSDKKANLILLCMSQSSQQELYAIGRYKRLFNFGFLKCPLWVVGSCLSPTERANLQAKYPDLLFFTDEEVSYDDPTGTGDFTGHHWGRGISQL